MSPERLSQLFESKGGKQTVSVMAISYKESNTRYNTVVLPLLDYFDITWSILTEEDIE